MVIASSVFENNGMIAPKYTCDGDNVNPPLDFSEIPDGAKTLVLIMDDPDAPGETWVHWLVWNISPNTVEIGENTVPEGAVAGVTSFGKAGYGGPCPPSGTHRYFFKLYALDIELDLPGDADKTELEEAMEGRVIEKAELLGLYSREK